MARSTTALAPLHLLPVLCSLSACDTATHEMSADPISVAFASFPGGEPMIQGDPLPVELRPQGVYGATVGLQLSEVAPDEVPPFSIEIRDPQGEVLAHQSFLSTSTGEVLDDGDVLLPALPVVFVDHVDRDRIDHTSARLSATLETSPPSQADLAVTLRPPD